MMVSRRAASLFTADPSTVSTKRLAWAYGCAKKGSAEEAALHTMLVERFANVRAEASTGGES